MAGYWLAVTSLHAAAVIVVEVAGSYVSYEIIFYSALNDVSSISSSFSCSVISRC